MPRSKNPARRLAKWQKKPRFVPRVKADGKPAVDWNACPPELRALEANRATTLGFFGDDAPIREMFEYFKLDPQDPWQWRVLLFYLATTHVRSWRPAKRIKWDKALLLDLWQRSQACGDSTDTAILKQLRAHWPKDYGYMSEGALRKRLIEARKFWPSVAP